MPLPTAYGTVPIGGALPEAYIDPFIPISTTDGANNLPTGYGVLIPAVSMTAAASGSSGIAVADDDDIDFGTGNFTIHWEGAVPDWTISSGIFPFYKYAADANRVFAIIRATGVFRIVAVVGGVTVFTEDSAASVETILSPGENAKLTYVCVRETASVDGSVAFYINGALFDTQSIPAAAAVSISNSGPAYISGTNAIRNASTTRACYLYNRALSAADVQDLCNNGVAAADVGASQTTAVSANFAAGLDGWTSTNNTNSFGVTKSGRTNCMESTCTSTTSPRWYKSIADLGLTGKNKIQVTIPIYIDPTSSGARVDVSLAIGTSAGATIVSTVAIAGIPKGQWNDYNVELDNSAGTATVVRVQRGTGVAVSDLWWLSSIGTLAVGNTLALAPTGLSASGLTWTDSSGNGNDGTLPAAGATKVTIRK